MAVMRLQSIQFVQESHRLQTDKAGATSKHLVAGPDHMKRLVVLEKDEFEVRVFREKKAGSGEFEDGWDFLHGFPLAAIAQYDPYEDVSAMPPECVPVKERPRKEAKQQQPGNDIFSQQQKRS